MNPQEPQQPTVITPDKPAPEPFAPTPHTYSPVTPPNPLTPPSVSPMSGGTQYPPVSESPRAPRKIIPLIVGVVAVLVIGGIVMAVSGKKSKNDTPVIDATFADTSQPAETTKPVAALTKTPLNQTITTDLSYTVQVSELVRNFPAKYPETGQETVLVKVTISDAGSQYTGSSPYSSDFRLLVAGKEYTNSLVVSNHEATDAGYASLPAESATKAKPTSGYLIFDVPTGSDKLTLRYVQKERKVLGSSQTLPAKNYDVAL